jgi:hypothetical protein
MAKFRQLQARAMGSVRSKVQAVLKAAAVQVSGSAKAPRLGVLYESYEASYLDIRTTLAIQVV